MSWMMRLPLVWLRGRPPPEKPIDGRSTWPDDGTGPCVTCHGPAIVYGEYATMECYQCRKKRREGKKDRPVVTDRRIETIDWGE